MPEVIRLVAAQKRTNTSVVALLADLLAEAEAGEIEGIAIGIVRPCGSIGTAYSQSDNAGAMLGSLDLVRHRLIQNIEQDDD